MPWGSRRLIWTVLWTLLLVMPLIVTRRVKVVGHAELIPMEARIAFANQGGIVEETYVQAGQKVQAGDLLAFLDTKLIDSRLDHVGKEYNQADTNWRRASNVNKKIFEIDKALAEEKENVLLREKEQYRVTAPISSTLITRDSVIRQLSVRPVARGDEVFEIVPAKTAWNIAVNIPESEVGEFLKAYDSLDEGETIRARVILHAYPKEILDTHVLSVSPPGLRAFVWSATI